MQAVEQLERMPQGAIGPKQPLSSTEDRLAMVQRAQRMPMNEANQANADHVVRVSLVCLSHLFQESCRPV